MRQPARIPLSLSLSHYTHKEWDWEYSTVTDCYTKLNMQCDAVSEVDPVIAAEMNSGG
jgi:hypothetical protein